jgi:signal transduction histidine kinase
MGASPWTGLLLGVLVGFFLVHPISMLVWATHESIQSQAPLNLWPAFLRSFQPQMWPMMMLYVVLGALVGGILGLVLQRLREHRQRLDTLHQEFELQVATLRHHYKNLAIGINGFTGRIKRKLENLDQELRHCALEDSPAHQECKAMSRNVEILEDAAQRLTQSLAQELLFLKALTSESVATKSQDFFPFLIHAIKDLLDLRFPDKKIQVEINGQPLDHSHTPLVFPFEPYTMEVILQNILSNAMKFGDHIQVETGESASWVRVGIRDNGPGLEVDKLKYRLLAPDDRQKAESTHLGIKVSLHLMVKTGGRLSVWSKPGAGTLFVLEFPKQPSVLS